MPTLQEKMTFVGWAEKPVLPITLQEVYLLAVERACLP
jgi:hypothetical protein